MSKNLSPEHELILFCTGRRDLGFLKEIKKQKFLAEINWAYFLEIALDLEVAPLCFLSLKNSGFKIPLKIEKKLYKIFTLNSMRNLKLLAALVKILQTFNSHGIAVIALKGPLFSETYYGEAGAKICEDLDILIKREAYSNTRKALKDLGFVPVKQIYSEKFIMNFLRHRAFFKPGLPATAFFLLEVHWNFYTQGAQKYNMESVWETAEPKYFENNLYRTLSPFDILLHLAVSLRIHGFSKLKHFVDVKAVLDRHKKKIDWNKIVRSAVLNKQRTALFFTLFFTQELFKLELPASLLKKLKPGRIQFLIVRSLIKPASIFSRTKKKRTIFFSDAVNLLSSDSFPDSLKILIYTLLRFPMSVRARYFNNSPM